MLKNEKTEFAVQLSESQLTGEAKKTFLHQALRQGRNCLLVDTLSALTMTPISLMQNIESRGFIFQIAMEKKDILFSKPVMENNCHLDVFTHTCDIFEVANREILFFK